MEVEGEAGWQLGVRERSAGVYVVTAIHEGGASWNASARSLMTCWRSCGWTYVGSASGSARDPAGPTVLADVLVTAQAEVGTTDAVPVRPGEARA